MSLFTKTKWSSFMSGGIVAFFFMLCLYVFDKPLGMTCGYLMIFDYLQESIETQNIVKINLNWQIAFIFGVIAGGILTAVFNKEWKFHLFPEDRTSKGWIASSGVTPVQGFVGGFVVMTGIQLAGDSFLGHWVGMMQMHTGAWLYIVTVIISGILSVKFLCRGGG